MLFKRRETEPLWNRIRNLIWPRMGIKRLLHYYKHRTVRIPASEYAIASGLAFGCAISWTPTFGTHLLQCALFSWIARANWIASFLGSAFGNPWTTPVLMYIAYHVGKALFVATGHGDFIHPEYGQTFGKFLKTIMEGDITFQILSDNFQSFLLPTLVGGYTMALATFPLFYFPFYYMVKGARMARRARIRRYAQKEVLELTGQMD
jgi:uncharacterized protein (DUF2062 family)